MAEDPNHPRRMEISARTLIVELDFHPGLTKLMKMKSKEDQDLVLVLLLRTDVEQILLTMKNFTLPQVRLREMEVAAVVEEVSKPRSREDSRDCCTGIDTRIKVVKNCRQQVEARREIVSIR